MLENQLICIVGPTASGKTALSVALAKYINTEIISADSMQIYKGMDIGTAKPSISERDGVIHHMFDICEKDEDFSVARYVEMADNIAQDILKRGKIPIIVGGTGLYMDSLIECSIFSGDETDEKLRIELENFANEHGNEALHEKLRQVDAVSADRLHPNNRKRVIRALEVYYQTGMTIDEMNAKNKRPEPKYKALKIGVCPTDREILYDRINKRVDIMLEQGLLDEVRWVFNGEKVSKTALQAIGYKEFLPYLNGESSLDECVEVLKRHSRNYAKRQLTWLKRDNSIHWINYDLNSSFDDVFHSSTKFLHEYGL